MQKGQGQAWLLLFMFVVGMQPLSAKDTQSATTIHSGQSRKADAQPPTTPRKTPVETPGTASNGQDKKISPPTAEPEIKIGGWDRGGTLPKKDDDPTTEAADVTTQAPDQKPKTTAAAEDKESEKAVASKSAHTVQGSTNSKQAPQEKTPKSRSK